MAVPTLITELSTTAASNAPAGADSPSTLDDIQRAHAAFIAQLRDNTGFTTAKASSGANSDITSLTGLTTPLAAALGGSGMANGFAASVAAAGYQKLPSGLIIQWGIVTTDASGNATATFPIAFPTAALQGVCAFNNSTKVDVTTTIGALTTTTAYIGALSGGGAVATAVSFIVIGY